MSWSAAALLVAAVAASCCLAVAALARDGQVFAAALAAGLGIAAAAGHAVLSLRRAERRIAKLSEELTAQAQRLLFLESAARQAEEPSPLAQHVEALAQATGALAEALDAQDGRLAALENAASAPAAAEPETAAPPPRAEPVPERLSTREDFARAASLILGRLGPPPVAPSPAPALPAADAVEGLRLRDAFDAAPPPSEEHVEAELEAGRLEIRMQPVVTLPQRHVRLYAALPHLADGDGRQHGPDVVRPMLARRGRLERLDAVVLAQALSIARRLAEAGRDTAIAFRLSRGALGHAAFLDAAAGRLAEDREAASRLVVELSHAEATALAAHEAAGLARLRDLGTGLALADVPTLDQDWTALSRRGVDFVLMDVATILAPRPHATTAFLVAEAVRAGVSLVATGVEREGHVPDLLDFDVPLATGPAIAAARPLRPEILAPKRPSEPPAAPDGPASLRDFLRRVG